MKILTLGFLLATTAFSLDAMSQGMRGAAQFTDSEVFSDCKRVKYDLEDRAKTLMELPGISKRDLTEIENHYRKVKREIEVFSQLIEQDVLDAEANNKPIDVVAFDNEHCDDIAELYKMYNDEFLSRYETAIGENTKPMAARDCQTKRSEPRGLLSVNLDAYKTFRDNNLRPQAWGKL